MTSSIDPELTRSFEDASAALMDRIRQAIRGFYDAPPSGWETWERWRTPKPWEARVLPNLERYHGNLQAALRAYDAGDIEPITLEAASYAGLSKDIEFDMDWMREQDRLKVEDAIRQVVHVAYQIHGLGDDELTRMGR